MIQKQFDQALQKAENALHLASSEINDDLSPKLIPFYLHYADVLFEQSCASDDLFAAPIKNVITGISQQIAHDDEEEKKDKETTPKDQPTTPIELPD